VRVEELMRRKVETITEDGSAEQALKRMRAKKLRHLVVVRGNRVVGIVSDRDIAGLLLGDLRIDRTIDQVMSRGVAVVTPQTPVEDAAYAMRRKKIGALPVVSGDALVGIVTVSDLLDLVCRKLGAGKNLVRRQPAPKAPKKASRRVR
jgi:acetoin utilization protein AcuB